MASTSVAVVVTLLLALSSTAAINGEGDDRRKPYIVHMINSMKPRNFSVHEDWYTSLINGVSGSQSGPSLLLYKYDILLHGFAAKLTSAEARAIENSDGCLAAIPSYLKNIRTTHSPEFLGLSSSTRGEGLWSRYSNYGKDVIVGMVDSGVWPERKSFHDRGLGPVPSRWKGHCQTGEAFNSSHCNRKIIGARYYFKGFEANYGPLNASKSLQFKSARDSSGHGTHTASTVAGSAVAGSNSGGFAKGTARGMAPAARLAVYKACWGQEGCDESDIAAAMEDAVADGVDIISLSIGGIQQTFYTDHMAIAAFGAIQKGVFVSAAAGNFGPIPSSVENAAPWITTVGAGNMDREFPAPVMLGNHKIYKGSSLYRGVGIQKSGLVYASDYENSSYCFPGTLDPKMVKDKIVVCDKGLLSDEMSPEEKGMVVKEAGGAGMIVANDEIAGAQDYSDNYSLPAAAVSFWNGRNIKAYINSTQTPTATINPTGSTVVGKTRAPIVATFSARGPSEEFPDILKPDVIAPGVNILAASTKGSYALKSGSSMACPHVSGIAALIRAAHPSWSPAAIKSALMTSAQIHDNRNELIKDSFSLEAADPFAMGAGHVNPSAALYPGLVYDIKPQDYLTFLCSLNYTRKQIGVLTHKSISCPNSSRESAGDLNYPSFSVLFYPGQSVKVRRRTVTNVGKERAVYKVRVESSGSVKMTVEPKTLEFKKQNEKASFSVRFESDGSALLDAEFGEIVWECVTGGAHVVRSPVAIIPALISVANRY